MYSTFIDGKEEPLQLFYSTGDGEYVPFTGIQQATIIEEQKYDPELIRPSFLENGELTFTLSLTKRSRRNIKKLFREISNKIGRSIRKVKRAKEKERRAKLKSGGHSND